MTNYEPELGQMLFGAPYSEYGVPGQISSALEVISEALEQAAKKHKKKYLANFSPFGNTGNDFKCDTFSVQAYVWDRCTCDFEDRFDAEDETKETEHRSECIQFKPNFKWRDLEIRWYKWHGRGASCNTKFSDNRVSSDTANKMINECLNAIDSFDWDKYEDYYDSAEYRNLLQIRKGEKE